MKIFHVNTEIRCLFCHNVLTAFYRLITDVIKVLEIEQDVSDTKKNMK